MNYSQILKAVTKLAFYVGQVAVMTTAEKVVEYFQKKDTIEYKINHRSKTGRKP